MAQISRAGNGTRQDSAAVGVLFVCLGEFTILTTIIVAPCIRTCEVGVVLFPAFTMRASTVGFVYFLWPAERLCFAFQGVLNA